MARIPALPKRRQKPQPIHGAGGKVLGTFANYYRFVRDPSPLDRELTGMITRTAAMAIERDREARLAVPA